MSKPIRQATVLANFAARGVQRRFDAERTLRFLRAQGLEPRLVTPASAAEGRLEARASAERGDDMLFVVGGDGTLRDAAAGLAGSRTALAAIPAGTANVWARGARIPRGIRSAFVAHLQGQVVPMDLGFAAEEPFLLMASAGWDAAIAARVRPWLKRQFGIGAYLLEAAKALGGGLRPNEITFSCDHRTVTEPVALIVASNTPLYGGLLRFTPGAMADDGQLDMCAVAPARRGDGTRLALRLATGTLARDARVTAARCRELRIETPGLLYQLDGDVMGRTPVTLRAAERALMVSLPPGRLPPFLHDRP